MAKGNRGGKRGSSGTNITNNNKIIQNKNVEDSYDSFKADMASIQYDNDNVWDDDKERAKVYAKYQDGVANKDNFFYSTYGEFEKADKPDRPADYVSRDRNGKISSQYWYTDEGVYRVSNHWGHGVASCDWYLLDNGRKKSNLSGLVVTSTKKCGFIKWSDLLHKPNQVNINGKNYLSTFKNTVGKSVKINGKQYQYNDWTGQWYTL